jgi:hypothetical protein
MKKSLILFAAAALLAGCSSGGIALTKDNASTYFELGSSGSGWTDCIMGSYDSAQGQYSAYFDIYPTKYMPNNQRHLHLYLHPGRYIHDQIRRGQLIGFLRLP